MPKNGKLILMPKKKTPKKRNPVAKALPTLKPQVVPNKTRYRRKKKHKKDKESEV